MDLLQRMATACVLLVASATLAQGEPVQLKRSDLGDWLNIFYKLWENVKAMLEKVKDLPEVVIKSVESLCSINSDNCKVFGELLDTFKQYPATVIEKTVDVCVKSPELCRFMLNNAKGIGSLPAAVVTAALDYCGSTPTACVVRLKGLLTGDTPSPHAPAKNHARAHTAMSTSPWYHVITLIILMKCYLRF